MAPRPSARIGVLFVLAGILFWFFGPAAQRGDVELPGPYDGPIRLLVLGDAQLLRADGRPGWPTVAKNVLKKEAGRHVELTVDSAGTAAELAAYLRSLAEPYPHFVVASLGWEDGAPGDALADPGAKGRVARLAASSVYDGGGFYLRSTGGARTSPRGFLEQLDDAKRAATEKGVPLVFVEQTARVRDGPVDIAPTTGARPGPWIGLVGKLREQARAQWWSEEDPFRLTPEGHRRIGGLIGGDLAARVRDTPPAE